jgi:hypothetical protein
MLVVGEKADVSNGDTVIPAATAFSTVGVPVVAVDVYADLSNGPARGDAFDDLRASDLARTISTVNDLDLDQGPTTAVLALADLLCIPPIVGHYGYVADTKNLPDYVNTTSGACVVASAK